VSVRLNSLSAKSSRCCHSEVCCVEAVKGAADLKAGLSSSYIKTDHTNHLIGSRKSDTDSCAIDGANPICGAKQGVHTLCTTSAPGAKQVFHTPRTTSAPAPSPTTPFTLHTAVHWLGTGDDTLHNASHLRARDHTRLIVTLVQTMTLKPPNSCAAPSCL
jgi:hypothetical protein